MIIAVKVYTHLIRDTLQPHYWQAMLVAGYLVVLNKN
jgi:hypothetical protein